MGDLGPSDQPNHNSLEAQGQLKAAASCYPELSTRRRPNAIIPLLGPWRAPTVASQCSLRTLSCPPGTRVPSLLGVQRLWSPAHERPGVLDIDVCPSAPIRKGSTGLPLAAIRTSHSVHSITPAPEFHGDRDSSHPEPDWFGLTWEQGRATDMETSSSLETGSGLAANESSRRALIALAGLTWKTASYYEDGDVAVVPRRREGVGGRFFADSSASGGCRLPLPVADGMDGRDFLCGPVATTRHRKHEGSRGKTKKGVVYITRPAERGWRAERGWASPLGRRREHGGPWTAQQRLPPFGGLHGFPGPGEFTPVVPDMSPGVRNSGVTRALVATVDEKDGNHCMGTAEGAPHQGSLQMGDIHACSCTGWSGLVWSGPVAHLNSRASTVINSSVRSFVLNAPVT
ncbi:unnamed protein product [Diplocarpon coronariae]